jgi:hypothetical protein
METGHKNAGREEGSPRKKGGGDGSAKDATETTGGAKTKTDEPSSAEQGAQGRLRSREIKTTRG